MISKRIFDLLFVIPGIIISLPLFVLISVWIKFDTPGPVLFKQERVGRYGKRFFILKFRTMVMSAESLGAKVTTGQDPRITGSGSFLRKYRLDELPQFFNVLIGHMSLVGPRPEVPEYQAYWPKEMSNLILSVPPGITDPAAINFLDEGQLLEGVDDPVNKYITEIMPEKLEYYKKYVLERNVLKDFYIVLKTIAAILK